MLTTNLFKKVSEDTTMAKIALTIKYEGYKMAIEILNDKAVALQKRIENKSGAATAEMIKGYKSELAEVLKAIEENNAKAEELTATAEEIESVIDSKLIRILASAENSKYEKYAITWTDEESEDLYNAMCNIHGFDYDKLKSGNFKKSTDLLEKIVRIALSFPETEYTEKVTVRLNTNDLRLIGETWVVGARNKYSKDKKADKVTYKATEEKFIVTKRQKKNEDPTYNWSKFNAVLVKIAIAKIANI